MGKRTLIERKQEALKNLNKVTKHFAQITEDIYLQHIDIFQPMQAGLSALRWDLNQIDRGQK